MKVGSKVNVNLTQAQMAKLGIQNPIKNPCTIMNTYHNGVDGFFVKPNDPGTEFQLGIPNRPGYITEV